MNQPTVDLSPFRHYERERDLWRIKQFEEGGLYLAHAALVQPDMVDLEQTGHYPARVAEQADPDAGGYYAVKFSILINDEVQHPLGVFNDGLWQWHGSELILVDPSTAVYEAYFTEFRGSPDEEARLHAEFDQSLSDLEPQLRVA